MQLELPSNLQNGVLLILNVLFGYLRWFVHVLLTWIHQGKGRIVPRIQNPLLLKSATNLAKEIREGKLKSEDVVHAYMERIQEVEPYINATVECVFGDALQKAKQVDALVASGKYTTEQLAERKPLLGVPISVKILMTVKGLLSTGGSKIHENVRATEDSPCVALMKNAGAIVIATTNIPECGMHLETNNLVHGRTRNPYNTSRTSGGSSGGESALISAGGSILGLGNDLLGSIRLPCHFTSLFGHKPSRGLVPNNGCFPAVDAEVKDFLSTGPMCRYAEDLLTSMSVLSMKSETSILFKKSVDFKKLKICYMTELRDLFASPVEKQIETSLKKAVCYFQAQHGVTVKQVSIPSMKNTLFLTMHILFSTMTSLKDTITTGKETPINEKIDFLKLFIGKSTFSLSPLLIMNFFTKYPIYNESHVPYYQTLLRTLVQECEDLLDEDTVLFVPTFPVTAPYHEEIATSVPSIGYTAVFNFLGLPSTQCPLGFDNEGLPFGMQIVGRHNNDALTIACAVELEKVFGGWIPPGNA